MLKSPYIALLAATFLFLSMAPSARAGDTKCLWDHLSQSTQDTFIHVKSEDFRNHLPQVSPSEARAAFVGCVTTKEGVRPAAVALESYAIELAEKQKTDAFFFPSGAPVDVVWRELSPNDRANFRDWLASRKPHQGVNAEDIAHYAIVLRPLGVRPDQYSAAIARPQYINAVTYFMARSVREKLEAQF